ASQTRHAGEPVSHFTPVSAVEFHPDGDSILTGSVDGVVRLWDLHTGAVRAELKLDGSAVTLAFSPDGTMALVGNVHMKTFRGTTGILRIPQAPRADSKRLKLMVEVRTNFRLDENGALRRLTQEEWLERKGRLAARDPGR
ncbi:MAG: hypothetical protein OER88_13330, partial [Planctomycetota bacterium]|nr:hypothetical protein [Planctomycetota bacterium]